MDRWFKKVFVCVITLKRSEIYFTMRNKQFCAGLMKDLAVRFLFGRLFEQEEWNRNGECHQEDRGQEDSCLSIDNLYKNLKGTAYATPS
jgi:hypothetical protein